MNYFKILKLIIIKYIKYQRNQNPGIHVKKRVYEYDDVMRNNEVVSS